MSVTRATRRRPKETRAQRLARHSAPGSALRLRLVASDAAFRADRLRKRRRAAAVILAGALSLCGVATAATARIVAGYDGADLTWWIGFGGKRSHAVHHHAVPTGDATRFAMTVTAVPVMLAVLSLTALCVPRIRDTLWSTVPAWVGAWLAPGLAVGVVASFLGSVAGQDGDDFLPALAGVAPQGLPLFAFFAVAPVLVWAEDRRKGGRSKRRRTARARA
ncbi:hypothetical protein [Cellulomonas sp. URHB0016]